eukprot:7379520-Prymnesium_polylepis.4
MMLDCSIQSVCEVLAVSMNGKGTLATGDSSGRAIIWNEEDGHLDLMFDCGGKVWAVALRGEDEAMRLATGDSKGMACIWNARRGSRLKVMNCSGDVHGVALSKDGVLLSGDSSGALCVWEVITGIQVLKLGCNKAVRAVGLSEDSELLVSGDEARCARIYDLCARQMLHELTCG